MDMYERYLGKTIKIVWRDCNQEKAVVGILTEFYRSFITLKTDRGTFISIAKDAIVTIAEYVSGRD